MTQRLLNNNITKFIIGTICYLIIAYKTEIIAYEPFSWLLYGFMIISILKINLYDRRNFKTSLALSSIYSILLIVGKTVQDELFSTNRSIWKAIFTPNKLASLIFTFILVYVLLINILTFLDKHKMFEEKNSRNNKKWIFIGTFIIVLLSRIPFFLATYPGLLTPDSISEMKEIICTNCTLSNRHPLIHLLFMYIPYQIGINIFHDVNQAVALATFTQVVVTTLLISYIITYLYKNNVKKTYIVLSLLFYTFLPIHGYYSVTLWKDIMFSYLMVILIIITCELYKKYFSNKSFTKKDLIIFIILSLLVVLFRNNAIYAYVLFAMVLVIVFRKQAKKIIISTMVVIVTYYIILYPFFNFIGVKRSPSAEYIAIPLQQIGRMAYKDVKFTEKEKALISKVIDVNILKEDYYPANVDSIKFDKRYNSKYFDNHKSDYLKLWFSLVLKHPSVATEAYLTSTVGYWYPGIRIWNAGRGVEKNKYGIKEQPKGNKTINNIILSSDDKQKDIYLLNMFLAPAFGFWILLALLFASMKKQKEKLVIFAPLLGIWITMMIASPVYGEYRYVYSMLLAIPVLGIVPSMETKNPRRNGNLLNIHNKLFAQMFKFLIVGGLAFVIDYLVLIICKEVFGISVLLSAAIAFTISVIFNYLLSIKWVFEVDQSKSKKRNFILFIVLSIVGLIITEIIMEIGCNYLNIYYLIVKIFATAVVMVFNFITRKIFLEKNS